jgi:hypothetical protein
MWEIFCLLETLVKKNFAVGTLVTRMPAVLMWGMIVLSEK